MFTHLIKKWQLHILIALLLSSLTSLGHAGQEMPHISAGSRTSTGGLSIFSTVKGWDLRN